MGDVFVVPFRGGPRLGGPFAEPPAPASVRDTARAAAESVRLAWESNPRGILLVGGLSLATATAELAQLLSGKRALDALLAGERSRAQVGRLLTMGALTLVGLAGEDMSRSLQSPVGQAVSRRAEDRVLDAATSMELADVEDPDFQDRLQRALMAAQRESALVGGLLELPRLAIGLVASAVALTSSDRALAPFALVAAAPEWLLGGRLRDPTHFGGRGRSMRERMVLRQYLTGTQAAHELRVFGAGPYLRARHDALVDEAEAAQAAATRAHARRRLLLTLINQAAAGPTAARLALRVGRDQAAVGDAVAGGVATQRLAKGFRRIARSVTGLRQAAAMVSDYRSFAVPDRTGRSRPAPPAPFERICVRGLSFTYRGGDRPVLSDVDLDIGRGEVVALVGENGSGKTTLAKLLCCLYEPAEGSIRWDGVDVAGCDPAAVRDSIAVVFQDFVRYPSLSAGQNIGIGRPARMADQAAIEAAARAAGVHDVIVGLSAGYDTVLSRQFGGVDLSTGQWQRLALARAFLRDAPLVVLDEPTAALDPRAERNLFETVASLYRSRSALLISHRLSSVRFADRICVLAGGRVVETGTHEELLAAGGVYAELFELQATAYR